MAVNSSNKGKVYERKIAKILSKWCGFELIRTPMSGAWQGTAGDIKPKQNELALHLSGLSFPFTVECKNTKSWQFHQIFKREGEFYSWVKQVEREVDEDESMSNQEKYPLLIFSANYAPDYIAFPGHSLEFLHNMNLSPVLYLSHLDEYWMVTQLDYLLQSYTYLEFVRLMLHCYWCDED